MSRLGKKPVNVPTGVNVSMSGRTLTVKGPKGSVSRQIPSPLNVLIEGGSIRCTPEVQSPEIKPLWGLYRMLIDNMVLGAMNGYRKQLDIIGVGYKAQLKGKDLVLVVGYSHPVTITPPDGVKIIVEELNKVSRVTVEGADKEQVGQVAANIRRVRPPEPYQGKGVRYVGEHIVRKVGKTAGK